MNKPGPSNKVYDLAKTKLNADSKGDQGSGLNITSVQSDIIHVIYMYAGLFCGRSILMSLISFRYFSDREPSNI